MSKIKVYVRVRPALPGEFDVPGCVNCVEMEDVSCNWVQIKKEGEPRRYFARCWGPLSTQEEPFRTIGVNTVNDVFEGYYGCIFVYGQSGTGKTFTLGCTVPGLEGIQPRCIKFAFEKMAKESAKYETKIVHQYVQMYRDNVMDLWDIDKPDLSVRVDATIGAIIDGVTCRESSGYDDSMNMIKEGDANRAVANTKLNSGSSRSHACLITEVHRKNKETGAQTVGKLYLIDLAGSERVSKSGVTGEQYQEAVAINKSLTTLGNCISALVNGEKVVAFRDSKLTRVLQHSLSGNGRTSIIVTIRPDSPNMQETLCTLKFGERAQKVEAQMTPASYRDNVIDARDKHAIVELGIADSQRAAIIYKNWMVALKASLEDKEADVRAMDAQTKEETDRVKADADAQKRAILDAWQSDKSSLGADTEQEMRKLTEANASVIEEINAKVKEAEVRVREKLSALSKKEDDAISTLKRELAKITEQVNAGSAEADEDLQEKAARKIRDVQALIAKAKKKLRGTKPSRNDKMLSTFDIREKEIEYKDMYEKLKAHKEALQEKTEGWNVKAMVQALGQQEPTAVLAWVAETKTKLEAEEVAKSKATDAEDDDSAPPSSEPPPSDSDEDSDSDSDSDSSDDSDSDSDSSDDDSDDDDDDEEEEEKEPEARVVLNFDMPDGKKKIFREVCPRVHFDTCLKRDKQLSDLLEQIVEYLEYGSPVFFVNIKSDPPTVHKRHMFVAKNRKSLCMADYKDGNDNQPDRNTGREIFSFDDVSDIVLGQFSPAWQTALEGAPMVPHGTTMPPTSAKVTMRSLPVFFYRSASLHVKGQSVVDCVFDTDTDFEAWIVTIHRLTGKNPRWGGPLDITGAKDVAKLTDEEKKLCSESHILPSAFITTKNQILHKEIRLFYTLFDLRSISALDLMHAQRLFEFFLHEQTFERVSVYQTRYIEILAEQHAEQKARDEARALRVRIVNMCRKYAPESLGQLHAFLKSVSGREQEALDKLVGTHGAEPNAAEVEVLEAKYRAAAAPSGDDSGGVPPPPDDGAPPPPPPPDDAPSPPPS